MKYLLLGIVLLPLSMMSLSGCGSSSSEVPALTVPPEGPSEEQQKKWMEESMKHGSAPKNYKPPKPKK